MSAILQTSSFVDCTVLSTELFNELFIFYVLIKEMSYILKK
jgi:hypothetical protein